MPDATTLRKVTLELTVEELDLLRTALRLLRSTLGRDEAGELDEIREVLTRLESLATPTTR